MNLSVKPNSLQTFQVILYDRALHPELFPLKARRTLQHGEYELEAWIMPGAHMLRFRNNGSCLCELVTDQEDRLPLDGTITAFPCAGERDFEETFESKRMRYLTTVQTETLSENLYSATYEEMMEFAEETDALVHEWDGADSGLCLSLLDLQRFNKEVHAQSYHLMAASGLVVRTQTIFEHK